MKPASPGLGLTGLLSLALLTGCGAENGAAQFMDDHRYPRSAAPVSSPLTKVTTPEPAASATPQTFTMPDVVGKDGRAAFKTMQTAGYQGRAGMELHFQSEDRGKRVFVIKNWTVTRQSAAAGSAQGVREEITLTVRK